MCYLINKFIDAPLLYDILLFNIIKRLKPSYEDSFMGNFERDFIDRSLNIRIMLYIRKLISKHAKLSLIIEKLYTVLYKYHYYSFIEETIRKYIPHIIVYVAILYDLKNNQIHYFYYAILVYSSIIIYRKVKKTIREYDIYGIDEKLTEYFYKKKIHQDVINGESLYEQTKIIYKSANASDIYDNYKGNIKSYIERDYVIDYVELNFEKSYQPFNIRLIFISLWFLYYIFCYNSSTINNMIITIPLLLAMIIYELFHKYKKIIIYTIPYIISYTFLIGTSVIIFIWVYLTRHNFYFMTEIICSKGIIIEQHFSIIEKLNVLLKYLTHIIEENKTLSLEEKTNLYLTLKEVNIYLYITEDTKLKQIKAFCDNIVEITHRLELWKYQRGYVVLESSNVFELLDTIKNEQLQKNPINRLLRKAEPYMWQIMIARNIYDYYCILDVELDKVLWHNGIFYKIFSTIKTLIFLIAIGTFCINKISLIILMKLFKYQLAIMVKQYLLDQNVSFNMTDIEIMDFCLRIADFIIKTHHPVPILLEIFKYKH